MKIIVTYGEVLDRYVWDKFCDMKGISEWCLKEGLADREDTAELTEDEARKLGLLRCR